MKKILSTFKHGSEIKLIKASELFDERYYLTHYPEASKSGMSPLEHYVKLGSAAGMRPNAYFDDAYYRDTNPDIKKSSTNPLVHFIKYGAREGRNPCRSFNTRYYLQEHPDVAETGANPLWHFLTYGAAEDRETDNTRKQVLSAEFRSLYDELLEIEPLLPPFDNLEYVPLVRQPGESLAGRAYFKLSGMIEQPFTHLMVLQRLIHGGAATMSMNYARLIKERCGADAVVVILADLPDRPAIHLVPDGVKMIALDDLQPGLNEEDKIQIISRLIVETRPKLVHNVDSNVCWQAYLRYNRQFHPHSSLAASLFMFTYNATGRKAGYASEYLNSCIDNLDLLLTDNEFFKKEASELYALEEHNQNKIVRAYTPIMATFRQPDPEALKSKRILWSSRIHPDKRPDLVAEIARCLPDYTFELYGASALSDEEMLPLKSLKNINLHGAYSSSKDLPYKGIGAYLHTTKHEGGAITLKDAVASGLPAIAPATGGIWELVNSDTGWLVNDVNNPEAYAEAIRQCLSNAEERIRRTLNAQELIRQKHSWDAFAQIVSGTPAYKLI